jgi:hypothetical protein
VTHGGAERSVAVNAGVLPPHRPRPHIRQIRYWLLVAESALSETERHGVEMPVARAKQVSPTPDGATLLLPRKETVNGDRCWSIDATVWVECPGPTEGRTSR